MKKLKASKDSDFRRKIYVLRSSKVQLALIQSTRSFCGVKDQGIYSKRESLTLRKLKKFQSSINLNTVKSSFLYKEQYHLFEIGKVRKLENS